MSQRRPRAFDLPPVVWAGIVAILCGMPEAVHAQRKIEAEEAVYYRLLTFEPPPGEVIEPGAIEMMPDGKVAVGTRRGEIWMVENALADDPKQARFSRFAHGLHEILGLAQKDGWLYVVHRPDVTRIRDRNGDGKADVFETFCEGWEMTGDHHEYAFGSKFDREGNIWVALCLTGSFSSEAKYRGWAGKVTPQGQFIPTTSGVRSPGGVGFNAAGDVFYTDNQGPWNGTCALKQITVGGFVGHPDSFRWYETEEARYLGPAPLRPSSGGRLMVEAQKIPQLVPPAVYFPYGKMGQSAAGIECDLTGGKFGPFEKQLFVGDQTHSTIMRVFLEKVNGRYQGACFPFRQGLACGTVPVCFAPDGSLFAGGTARGWGSRGSRQFSIERLVWTGKVPFEVHEMRIKPDGFELTFTQPVDPKSAAEPASYRLKTYTYIYQSNYGSPEVDPTTPKIFQAEVSEDRRRVRLRVEKLQIGHVHELHLPGVRSSEGQPLLHTEAYYTLNVIPER